MARNERHREQIKKVDSARDAAHRRLREAHPEEYRKLYEEEAVARGIVPASVRRENKRRRLMAYLARRGFGGSETRDLVRELCSS